MEGTLIDTTTSSQSGLGNNGNTMQFDIVYGSVHNRLVSWGLEYVDCILAEG